MLTRLAAISPLVVLLDDIQWAEPTAVTLLRHLGHALVSVPVLLILSARDTDERRSRELRAVLAGLECRPGRRICLGGFEEDELARLTASLLAVDATAVASAVRPGCAIRPPATRCIPSSWHATGPSQGAYPRCGRGRLRRPRGGR